MVVRTTGSSETFPMLEKGKKVRLGRSRNDLDQALREKKVKDGVGRSFGWGRVASSKSSNNTVDCKLQAIQLFFQMSPRASKSWFSCGVLPERAHHSRGIPFATTRTLKINKYIISYHWICENHAASWRARRHATTRCWLSAMDDVFLPARQEELLEAWREAICQIWKKWVVPGCNISQIYPRYIPDKSQIYPRYIPDISQIYPRYIPLLGFSPAMECKIHGF